MRRENELDVPNVHDHTLEARHRTNNGGGRLHRVFDEPELKWWQRYFQWENLTVGNREVKGFVVSPAIAAILLTAFLGAVGWAYKSNTEDSRNTRDAIIRMETVLNERTTAFKEQQAKAEKALEDERTIAQLQREKQAEKYMQIVWALKQRGITVSQ